MSDDSKLARRLMSRATGGLYRRSTPDGGEVYTGPAARKALRALGARAFTMDSTIIVDEGFDTSRPEDAALYANELHHQTESGGHGAQGERDSEEIAARAIERMVFHRMEAGDDFSAIMRDARAGGSGEQSYINTPPPDDDKPAYGDAIRAYEIAMAEGIPYDQLVRDLSRFCVEQLNSQHESVSARKSKNSTF